MKINIPDKMLFAHFLSSLRKSKTVSLRDFATLMGLSAPYVHEIEKGKKAPFSSERMHHVKTVLGLSEAEYRELCDAAALWDESRVAPDIVPYLRNSAKARLAVREAMANGLTEEEWDQVIELIRELGA